MAEPITPEEFSAQQSMEFAQKIEKLLSPVFDEIATAVKQEAQMGIQLQQAATVVAVSTVYWAGVFEGICAHAVKLHMEAGADIDIMALGEHVVEMMRQARLRGFTDGTKEPLHFGPVGHS